MVDFVMYRSVVQSIAYTVSYCDGNLSFKPLTSTHKVQMQTTNNILNNNKHWDKEDMYPYGINTV